MPRNTLSLAAQTDRRTIWYTSKFQERADTESVLCEDSKSSDFGSLPATLVLGHMTISTIFYVSLVITP